MIKNTDLVKEGLSLLPEDNWLYKYLKYTDTMESPSFFHIWSGLAALSSALQRKVFISQGDQFIYPNQYIYGPCRLCIFIHNIVYSLSNFRQCVYHFEFFIRLHTTPFYWSCQKRT